MVRLASRTHGLAGALGDRQRDLADRRRRRAKLACRRERRVRPEQLQTERADRGANAPADQQPDPLVAERGAGPDQLGQEPDRGARGATSHWTAILTVVLKPPASTDTLRKNLLGLYVDAIDWSRELETTSPPAGPAPTAGVPANIPFGLPREVVLFAPSTGLRQGNMLGLPRDRVDVARRIATIEHGDTKNGEALGVPLNDIALGVLERQHGKRPAHIFTYGVSICGRRTRGRGVRR